MAGKDIIMVTQEELKKLHIIRKALDGREIGDTSHGKLGTHPI